MIEHNEANEATAVVPVELTGEQLNEIEHEARKRGYSAKAVINGMDKASWARRLVNKVMRRHHGRRLSEFVPKGAEVELLGKRFKVVGIGNREIVLRPASEDAFVDMFIKGQKIELRGILFKVHGVSYCQARPREMRELVLRSFSKKELKQLESEKSD